MLDWLASKFVMIIAALLILSTALCLICSQRYSLEEFELKSVVDKIADNVNAISNNHGETKLVLSFVNNTGAASIPHNVRGKSYVINISQDFVIVAQDSKRYSRRFFTSVHPWNPHGIDIENANMLKEIDEKNRFMVVVSGSDFTIERKLLFTEDGNEFHTFVYKE